MTELKEIKPEYPDPQLQEQISGRQLFYAPIQALTAASGSSAGSTYTSTEQGIINNHTTRIADIEAALIKLGLLKHI